MASATSFSKLTIGSIIVLLSGTAMAKGDCWMDIYTEIGFKGEHARIEGPAQLSNLRAVGGSDWSNRIDSLIVGPKALVQAFRKEAFQDDHTTPPNHPDALKAWGEKAADNDEDNAQFGPNQKHHHLGELNFHHNINSLKITCMK
ncbi:MAG: hypothetical protein EPN21_17680 [Methylococcaceae bacterium]|nr:MAG: hypothetical protein EPN21_17680 [Methylococcaceae bacterium]